MAICGQCGKRTVLGNSQKHKRGVAGKRWRKRVTKTPRTFKPNLQKTTIVKAGEEVQMVMCTKCIKRAKLNKSLKSQQIQL